MSRGTSFGVQNLSDRFCAPAITKTKGQKFATNYPIVVLLIVLIERAHNDRHEKMFEKIKIP